MKLCVRAAQLHGCPCIYTCVPKTDVYTMQYMHAAAGLALHEDAPSDDDVQAINSVTGA
jgi:hypothetical protein